MLSWHTAAERNDNDEDDVDDDVTEPCQTLIRLHFTKSNQSETDFAQPHIWSIIPRPSGRLSPQLPAPSLRFHSCPAPNPTPTPTPRHSSRYSDPPCTQHTRRLALFVSCTLPPLLLSIHTTESLLIICDLLKYIHCHSPSLPLSSRAPSPLPSARSPVQQPPRITHSLTLSLSPSLSRSTFSLFCLFCSAG